MLGTGDELVYALTNQNSRIISPFIFLTEKHLIFSSNYYHNESGGLSSVFIILFFFREISRKLVVRRWSASVSSHCEFEEFSWKKKNDAYCLWNLSFLMSVLTFSVGFSFSSQDESAGKDEVKKTDDSLTFRALTRVSDLVRINWDWVLAKKQKEKKSPKSCLRKFLTFHLAC